MDTSTLVSPNYSKSKQSSNTFLLLILTFVSKYLPYQMYNNNIAAIFLIGKRN